MDVEGINGLDSLSPLFYDGQQQMLSASSGSSQVLTITSFSLTPYGSRRMVQYTVAQSSAGPMNLNLNFAPMMILGDSPVYNPPHPRRFQATPNYLPGA